MYLSMRIKSLMSLKVRSNLGLAKKIQNPKDVGLYLVNHAKRKSSYGNQ